LRPREVLLHSRAHPLQHRREDRVLLRSGGGHFDGRDDADSQRNPTHCAGIMAPDARGVIDFGG
jgi:hypothetical protein